jgi:hypothetical protein
MHANNRVGLGTTAPTTNLHITQTLSSTNPMLTVENGHASGSGAIRTTGGATHYMFGSDPSDNTFKIANSTTSLGTNTRLTINSTGNVGIGTTAPQATLQISNASPRLTLTSSVANNTSGSQLSEIWFNDAVTSNPQAGIRVFRDGNVAGDAPTAMVFYTTATQ